MIHIQKSKTADTRSCDFSNVTKEQLQASSIQHIDDVKKGMEFVKSEIDKSVLFHDFDKLTELDQFHADFITGFKQTIWWENHRKVNRHHLQEGGVPENVNLVDVIEMVVDCVMAAGTVYPIEIKTEVLMEAFHNTVKLLKKQVVVDN